MYRVGVYRDVQGGGIQGCTGWGTTLKQQHTHMHTHTIASASPLSCTGRSAFNTATAAVIIKNDQPQNLWEDQEDQE